MQSTKIKIVALVAYSIVLCAIQHFAIITGLEPNQNAVWLYNGIASLLFGSRLLNPYFTPPLDAAANSFAALSSLVAVVMLVPRYTIDAAVLGLTILFCGSLLILSFMVLLARPHIGIAPARWQQACDRAVRLLGAPHVIYTIVILVLVWLFHRDRSNEVFTIVSSYAVIMLLRPIEEVISYVRWFRSQDERAALASSVVGIIAAYQSPNIALIRQGSAIPVPRGTALLVAGEQADWLLGVALNYVGRDEGNLLRVLTATLPPSLHAFTEGRGFGPSAGVALTLPIPDEEKAGIPALEWINRLCGIVDSDTSFDMLRFEVIDEQGLSEGRLIEARIADERSVLFQLIDGVTHEEIVQQKNKYGYARATARKIGRWDADEEKFCHVPWLPKINSPVFLRDPEGFNGNARYIGHFPGTAYGLSIDPNEAVTHNTAILGILGVGKTYLAAELIERMIAKKTRVICLDLTNQYEDLFGNLIDEQREPELRDRLTKAGAGGKPHQNRDQGGSRGAFRSEMIKQLTEFMTAEPPQYLRILNPSQYEVTRQQSGMYQGSAELLTLTPCEITAIVSDAALHVCQNMGMTDTARLCLVYEEAHSLVPEWNSVVAEGDKNATATSARAILQGRKFGLGCLLITQRTANVTKTILNQCNTIFAMRTYDDTGKEFLSNYIGSDYSGILPSLEPRHAVVFGKASNCENPVVVRLNDRDKFVDAFRAVEEEPVAGPAVEIWPMAEEAI